MATGFGIDPTTDANGVVVNGTESADIRRITDALYTPGVIKGGVVTTRTDMNYDISLGVGCVEMSEGENVLIPIPAATILTADGGVADRVDYVYVKQNDPATDATSAVTPHIQNTPDLPPGSVLLGKFNVPANATSTNAANVVGNVDYSIPYGTSGHSLWYKRITHNGPMTQIADNVSGTFFLPTDRAVEFTVLSTLDKVGDPASLYFRLFIDGIQTIILPTGVLSNWYTAHYMAYTFALDAGEHTIRIEFTASGSMSDINCRYNTGENAGIVMKLRDAGVMT